MKFSELIHAPSVIPELQATDRNGVIRELLQSLADHGAVSAEHVEALARSAIARENQGSTGFGKGDLFDPTTADILRSAAGAE